MTTTPLPQMPEPDIWSHVVTVWRDEVECQIDQGPRFTADQMQAYATQARADLEAEVQRLREALARIESWSSHTSEFAIDYGSNGVRDYYRGIASTALKEQP